MSVVNPKDKNSRTDGEEGSNRSASAATSERDGKVVDLFADKNLPKGEMSKLDKDEDAWSFAAPPPAGRYAIKIYPAKELCKLKPRNADDPSQGIYYSLAMECKVLDKDQSTQLATVFPYVNTLIGRGKSISTAAGLLVKLGFKIPDQADDYTIALLCGKAIRMEKIVDVECDWLGQYKDEKGDYKTAWKSMNDFPRDAEGVPMHAARYRDSKGNEYDVTARLEIRHWYSKGEASVKPRAAAVGQGSGQGGVFNGMTPIPASSASGAQPIRASALVSVLDEPQQEPVMIPATGNARPNAAASAQSAEDLLTLLEEA